MSSYVAGCLVAVHYATVQKRCACTLHKPGKGYKGSGNSPERHFFRSAQATSAPSIRSASHSAAVAISWRSRTECPCLSASLQLQQLACALFRKISFQPVPSCGGRDWLGISCAATRALLDPAVQSSAMPQHRPNIRPTAQRESTTSRAHPSSCSGALF